jgi:hypothetical protein
LLAEGSEPIEPPSPFGLLARSFTRHAAAVLLEDRQQEQWLRVSFLRDAGRWITVDQTVTSAAPRSFWTTDTGEVAWVHAKGTFDNHPAGIALQNLVILHKASVTALVIAGTRVPCSGTAGVTFVLSESLDRLELEAVVADKVVLIWDSPGG